LRKKRCLKSFQRLVQSVSRLSDEILANAESIN
jgi:hypothetical protein